MDVGRLDFGQTYYWRVDEVNAAPDSTIFQGSVWSFTTEPFAYPIANIIATSNGTSDEVAGPENRSTAPASTPTTSTRSTAADMWLANPPADEPLYIQYEFDRVYKLHEMLVWNYNVQFELILGFGLKDVTVEYSENGTDWTVLGDVEFAKATAKATYTANTTVDFGGVPAKYVRLNVNSGWGMMGQFGLSEVRFLYIPAQAREPQPADGAADVEAGTALTLAQRSRGRLARGLPGDGPERPGPGRHGRCSDFRAGQSGVRKHLLLADRGGQRGRCRHRLGRRRLELLDAGVCVDRRVRDLQRRHRSRHDDLRHLARRLGQRQRLDGRLLRCPVCREDDRSQRQAVDASASTTTRLRRSTPRPSGSSIPRRTGRATAPTRSCCTCEATRPTSWRPPTGASS